MVMDNKTEEKEDDKMKPGEWNESGLSGVDW